MALRLWILDLLIAMREWLRTFVATHREAKRKAIVRFEATVKLSKENEEESKRIGLSQNNHKAEMTHKRSVLFLREQRPDSYICMIFLSIT